MVVLTVYVTACVGVMQWWCVRDELKTPYPSILVGTGFSG